MSVSPRFLKQSNPRFMATSQRFARSTRRLNRIFALCWHNLLQKREADSGKQPSRSLGIARTLGDRMRQREWSVAIGAEQRAPDHSG